GFSPCSPPGGCPCYARSSAIHLHVMIDDAAPVQSRMMSNTPLTGTSADGSLRFENRYVSDAGGPPPDLAPTAWIWDAVTGETLADGARWTSSQVTPQPDGTLLLALRHHNRDALFRLDPTARTFRTLGERRPDESLNQLAGAIDRAHKASMDKA